MNIDYFRSLIARSNRAKEEDSRKSQISIGIDCTKSQSGEVRPGSICFSTLTIIQRRAEQFLDALQYNIDKGSVMT